MTQDFSAPAGARTITEEPLAPEPMATDGGTSSSTSDVAKEQAGSVAQGAAEAGQQVAGTAKDQASNVAAEASRQAQDLLAQTRNELQEQAATQQQRLASGIRSLSVELGSMAERSEQSGTASEVVRQASAKTAELAGWLDERDPGSLLQEVTSFARRRPGLFLAVAAGAGLAAGRLTRGAVDAARNDSDDSDDSVRNYAGSTSTPAATSTPAPTTTAGPSTTFVQASEPVLPADQPGGFELGESWEGRARA